MSTPRKSAFDVLMNRTNKPKEIGSSTKKPKIECRVDISDIIVLDDSRVNQTFSEYEKEPIERHQYNKTAFQHAHQYSDEDRDFIDSLKSDVKFAQNSYSDCSIKLPSTNCVSFSNFNFQKFDSYESNTCVCSNPINCECSNDAIFSVNNSLELETAFLDITVQDEESKKSSPKKAFSKKTSTSSLVLRNPNAKRRRTEKAIAEDTNALRSNKQDEAEPQLWTEKYQFKDASEIVTNKTQLERLREWLNSWKVKQMKRKSSDSNSNGTETNEQSGSEYSYSSDESSASTVSSTRNTGKKFYPNAIVLAGPHGSGKTSSVYVVAKQLGFKLFEVNASSLRSKSHIIQELEGALDSHHVSNRSNAALNTKDNKDQSTNKIDLFFKSGRKRPANDDEPVKKRGRRSKGKKSIDSSASTNTVTTVVNVHKDSLILFDEIEIVFKEDVGFWSTVSHFIKKSKKPIVITTNDEFFQEKMNLNVERIEFERPRVDASIRFLMSVAVRETGTKLEMPTVYEIVRECRCDMRRSLLQLQALICNSDSKETGSTLIDQYKAHTKNGTLNLDQAMAASLFLPCPSHNHDAYFESIFFLDGLVRHLSRTQYTATNDNVDSMSACFKPYDKLIIRDGLTDNSTNNSHFQSVSMNNISKNGSNVAFQNSFLSGKPGMLNEELAEFFTTFVSLFNQNKPIGFTEWLRHGAINQHGYASSACVDRVAQSLCKFSSSRDLALEYRPYLQEICRLEEAKQQVHGRKRFLHYLSQTNVGLLRDDYGLLAKSRLVDKPQACDNLSVTLTESNSSSRLAALLVNDQLYDDDC